MKKLLSLILSLTIIFTISVPAFAADISDTQENSDRISREVIESLFASKAATVSSATNEDEEYIQFLTSIETLQELYFSQEAAINAGESTDLINQEIAVLEGQIDQMTHAVRLTEENTTPTARGIKPTLPSSNSYINVYAYDKTATYNGKSYDVFEIYCASKRAGGFANPLGYEGQKVLASDSKWLQNEYLQQEIYAITKFTLGMVFDKFAIADFFVLSQMPSFFDDGSSQKVTVNYRYGQTFLFAYVAESGVNWYDHLLTTERLSTSDTVIAASTKNGITNQQSTDRSRILYANYYPTTTSSKTAANRVAYLYANYYTRESYYVGSVDYYVNGAKKATVNTNTYGELYSIPGL